VKKPGRSPEKTADQVAKAFFGVGTDNASRQRATRQLLLAAVESAVLVPLLFYWRFGEVDGLGWGMTVFFVVYCLLAAIGLYFRPRTEYHTPVRMRGDWADRVGAFWLVSCAFGPFLGWVVTSAFPITVTSWRWLYALRVILAVGAPLVTALPLTRYLRGKATLIALPILVVITLLPIWSAVNVGRDLWNGPVVRQVQSNNQPDYYLPYTEQILDMTR
jgi:hypothetical protein